MFEAVGRRSPKEARVTWKKAVPGDLEGSGYETTTHLAHPTVIPRRNRKLFPS